MDDLSVCASVCPVHCGKTADRIRMPFGIIGRTGPGMRQLVGFGDRSTGRGTFGGEFGARHCNQWGLCGVRVRKCRDAALFPNYFGQICYTSSQSWLYMFCPSVCPSHSALLCQFEGSKALTVDEDGRPSMSVNCASAVNDVRLNHAGGGSI